MLKQMTLLERVSQSLSPSSDELSAISAKPIPVLTVSPSSDRNSLPQTSLSRSLPLQKQTAPVSLPLQIKIQAVIEKQDIDILC
ncbi:hypothetical protein ACLB2K_061405 [Fragaria x ananassa]